MRFLRTIFKKLPIIVLKLYIVFESDRTVGVYYFFTISKSYVLFCKGIGQNIPFLFRLLGSRTRKINGVLPGMFILFQLLGLLIFSIPFFVFFKWDRSLELEKYGFIITPSSGAITLFRITAGGVLGILILIYLLFHYMCKKNKS